MNTVSRNTLLRMTDDGGRALRAAQSIEWGARLKSGEIIEWQGEGAYGLTSRAGETSQHWSKIREEMLKDWNRNEWDQCNNRSAREGWRQAGWIDMRHFREQDLD